MRAGLSRFDQRIGRSRVEAGKPILVEPWCAVPAVEFGEPRGMPCDVFKDGNEGRFGCLE